MTSSPIGCHHTLICLSTFKARLSLSPALCINFFKLQILMSVQAILREYTAYFAGSILYFHMLKTAELL